jgi:hypothetical protein
MSLIEATESNWIVFEEKINLLKTDVTEIPNQFLTICKLYVNNSDLAAWNETKNVEVFLNDGKPIYDLNYKHKWCALKPTPLPKPKPSSSANPNSDNIHLSPMFAEWVSNRPQRT